MCQSSSVLFFILMIVRHCYPLHLILIFSFSHSPSLSLCALHSDSFFCTFVVLSSEFHLVRKMCNLHRDFFCSFVHLPRVYTFRNPFFCCILVKIEFHVIVVCALFFFALVRHNKSRAEKNTPTHNLQPKINRQTK